MPDTPKRPLKAFLCHAHADYDAVHALYTRLTQDGVDVWLDKEKLLPGEDWEMEIRKAVREADVVVVCLSKQFNQAGFRQKEVRLALDTAMERPEGEIFIIPARLEECDTLESLRKWHWVDLFEENGYEMLMRALQVRADKIGATLQLKKRKGTKKTDAEERILEAAIERQVIVGKPASLFVWIRRYKSKNIISVVSSIDEDVILDEDNLKSTRLEIEFQIEDGRILSTDILLRLVAHEFTPSIQQKKITVPPKGDSKVCTFIITPNKVGKLLLNLEVLKDQSSIATRTLYTTAIESEKKEHSSMVSVSIPIVVFVQPNLNGKNINDPAFASILDKIEENKYVELKQENPKTEAFKLPSESQSKDMNVGGSVAGSVIVAGNGNIINVNNTETPLPKSEDDKKIQQELKLKNLESQAIQCEFKGDFWNARKIWYDIKRIDPLFPRVDIKIRELEHEINSRRTTKLNKVIIAGITIALVIIGIRFSPPYHQYLLSLSPSATGTAIIMPVPTFTSTPTSTITPTPTSDCGGIQVSQLKLNLATSSNQIRVPDTKGVINLTSEEIGTLAILSGEAIRTDTKGTECVCKWKGKINVNDAWEPADGEIGCGFSITIPKGADSIYLKLSINGQDTLFTIKVKQQ